MAIDKNIPDQGIDEAKLEQEVFSEEVELEAQAELARRKWRDGVGRTAWSCDFSSCAARRNGSDTTSAFLVSRCGNLL